MIPKSNLTSILYAQINQQNFISLAQRLLKILSRNKNPRCLPGSHCWCPFSSENDLDLHLICINKPAKFQINSLNDSWDLLRGTKIQDGNLAAILESLLALNSNFTCVSYVPINVQNFESISQMLWEILCRMEIQDVHLMATLDIWMASLIKLKSYIFHVKIHQQNFKSIAQMLLEIFSRKENPRLPHGGHIWCLIDSEYYLGLHLICINTSAKFYINGSKASWDIEKNLIIQDVYLAIIFDVHSPKKMTLTCI